ncbi:hypothetical protein [Moraxella lacunata]
MYCIIVFIQFFYRMMILRNCMAVVLAFWVSRLARLGLAVWV